jgi:hypothetical protein
VNSIEAKEILSAVITNLESGQPQQWSPEWIEKLRAIKDGYARTHDAYYDDAEPLVDALEFIGDHAHDYFYKTRDMRFGKIYNKVMEATGGTARITEDENESERAN